MKEVESLLRNSLFSVTMLLNLINDLLDLAKIENSSFNFNKTYFNLINVIQKSIFTLDFQMKQKNINVVSSFDPSSIDHFLLILGDENRYM